MPPLNAFRKSRRSVRLPGRISEGGWGWELDAIPQSKSVLSPPAPALRPPAQAAPPAGGDPGLLNSPLPVRARAHPPSSLTRCAALRYPLPPRITCSTERQSGFRRTRMPAQSIIQDGKGALRTARFARGWVRPDGDVHREEILLPSAGGDFETTRYRTVGGGSGPTWILLHGITRPGRRHRVLVRFAQALAGTGATVLIPEIPEWASLELAPEPAGAATKAALDALETHSGGGMARHGSPTSGRVGLIGFSFGAPQVIRLASDPTIGPRLACVAGFGGYGTLQRALSFLWSGQHEWEGVSYSIRPDPYGRWVVAGNFLPLVPGYEETVDVAAALTQLASLAGDSQIPSWDPAMDELKDRLVARLPPSRRELFRKFAPPSKSDPPGDAEGWAARLAQAGIAARPLLELPPVVRSSPPVVLIHGRGDALVPFSETLRLAERVHAPSVKVAVTGLFEHSSEARTRGAGWLGELWRLGGTLSSLLGSL